MITLFVHKFSVYLYPPENYLGLSFLSKPYQSIEPVRHQAWVICGALVSECISGHSGALSECTSGYGRCRNGGLLLLVQTRMKNVTEHSAKCRLVVLHLFVTNYLNVCIDVNDFCLTNKISLLSDKGFYTIHVPI